MPDHLLMDKPSQRGSVFFSIMAAVGMVAILGVGLTHFIQGPLKSATNVNRRNVAETQMQMSAKIAALTAAQQSANGDCDSDSYIEPVPYKDPGATAHPSGGGLLPDTMGTQKRDPWGTDYGYCVWDHGPKIADAACGGATQKRLAGTNSASWETVAVISAGPDRAFQTVCNPWLDTNADNQPDSPLVNKPSTSDDAVLTWTYAEAGAAAAGLWQLKTNDPAKATIGKDLEVTGGAQFSGALTLTQRGLVLPGDPGDNSITGACSLANDQQLRRNTSTAPPKLEICYESSPGVWAWAPVSGSDIWTKESNNKIHYDTANVGVGVADPVSKFEVNGNIKVGGNSTTCDNTTKGSYRFDTTDNKYKFCDGTQWVRFAEIQSTTTPTAPPGSGYFVLTGNSWNGNLGGVTGADAKCLTELTTNTGWKGYGAALAAGQLTASKVKAFLCQSGYGGPCNNLMPLTNYYFAVAGDAGAGGDYFTTDANGRGPGNTAIWSAANRFSGTYSYWSLRGATACGSGNWEIYGNGTCGNQGDACGGWVNSSSGTYGAVGNSGSIDAGRWNSAVRTCDQTNRLICYVDPGAASGCGGSGTITSSATTLQVSGGCNVTFKAWGAGGGRSQDNGSYTSGNGGGGGYATITLNPSTTTTYYLSAGGGGQPNTSGSGAGGSGVADFTGGSGAGPCGGGMAGSGGGGASGVWTTNWGTSGTPVIIAAGGGGGGGASASGNGSGGEAGGVASSQNTTTAGASGGSGGGCPNSGGGGGGGAGYSKGGGGGWGGWAGGAGGGGNSGLNYADTGGATVSGSGVTPGSSADPNRPSGIGAGATAANTAGGGGAIYYVIY